MAQDRKKASDFPPEVLKLFDGYVHGGITRREFLDRAARYAVGGFGAAAMLEALSPNFAWAQQVKADDRRITVEYAAYLSPAGSGKMRGYLARPAGAKGKLPAVIVIHENRGLNPYIEDVARRLAAEGYLAFAPDALTPVGGYPGNEDQAREMFAKLDAAKRTEDLAASVDYVKLRPDFSGKFGAVGFCFGGGVVNTLATRFPDMKAGAPYYGAQPKPEDVPKIKAVMLIHYASADERLNAGWPAYEAALKANKVRYQAFIYPNTQHGFHNDTTPRYDDAAAKLSWQRTLALFKENLKASRMEPEALRSAVLRGIAQNRIPGFHFAGTFLGIAFDRVDPAGTRVTMPGDELVVEADGSTNVGALAFLADMGLANAIRAGLEPHQRLATVAMHLQFNGERAAGPLEAQSAFEGFLAGANARQGLSRVVVRAGGRDVAFGTGAFMVLDAPPGVTMQPLYADRTAVPPLKMKDLTAEERAILRAASAAHRKSDAHTSFIRRFWGYEPRRTAKGAACTMRNGAQVGNRVGHVQGGILMGLAAATASAALSEDWRLSAITACFVSPGEGRSLRAVSTVMHQGRWTAVVRTQVTGDGGRRVLEVTSTHAMMA